MEVFYGLLTLAYIVAFFALIVGLIKPSLIWKQGKYRRLKMVGIFFVVTIIYGNILPEPPKNEQEKKDSTPTALKSDPKPTLPEGWEVYNYGKPSKNVYYDRKNHKIITIADDTVASSADKVTVEIYKEKYDKLYNELMKLDKEYDYYKSRNRSTIHEEINKLFYKDWWGCMMYLDSTLKSLPLNKKERDKAIKQHDVQYRRFAKYGDEDGNSIRYWAKANAEKILNYSLHDPGSLDIDDDHIRYKKTNKGYLCMIPYRAKNMYGAYVLDVINITICWDTDDKLYRFVQ